MFSSLKSGALLTVYSDTRRSRHLYAPGLEEHSRKFKILLAHIVDLY